MVYQSVLNMVAWDEDPKSVFRMLEVNGIVGESAQEMYRKARSDRIASIRAECWRRVLVGIVWLAAGIGVFSMFWFGFGWITRSIFVFAGLAGIKGVWTTIDGLAGVAMAPMKKGSLANDA